MDAATHMTGAAAQLTREVAAAKETASLEVRPMQGAIKVGVAGAAAAVGAEPSPSMAAPSRGRGGSRRSLPRKLLVSGLMNG